MAKNIGISVLVDARDATNAFKDLEHGFKRSHRAANEFGNILGGLSSELGGVGRALGAVGAALASGSIWGAAAAGVMLLVDSLKDMKREATEAAKEIAAEVTKMADAIFAAQAKLAGQDIEALKLKGQIESYERIRERRDALLARRVATGGEGELVVVATEAEDEELKTLNEILKTREGIYQSALKLLDVLNQISLKSAGGGLGGELGGAAGVARAKDAEELRKILAGPSPPAREFEPGPVGGAEAWEKPLITFRAIGPRAEAFRDTLRDIQGIGIGIGDIFSNLGTAFGGSAGKMMDMFGKLIQQAIQLAIAMSATGGPYAWLNIAAAAAAIFATIASVPKYETGTPYVPRTGLAMLHEGEAVVPAGRNFGGMTINIVSPDALAVERLLIRNRGALARTQDRLMRDRRRG